MAAIKENKMKPGEFKFQPAGDWVCLDVIHIESKTERKARLANLNIVGGAAPKNIIEIENQRAKDQLTYAQYTKEAVDFFDGKHGFQGIIKAIGPRVDQEKEGYKVGDKIYVRGQTGEPMVHNKRLFWLFKPHEIYGKAPLNEHDI